jgi:hypothetical protein
MSESPRSNNSKVNATDVDINSTKTTGNALDLKSNKLTSGNALSVASTSNTVLTTGSLVSVAHTGNANTVVGPIVDISTTTTSNTLDSVLKVSNTAQTAGNVVEITGVAGQTALNVTAGNTKLGGVVTGQRINIISVTGASGSDTARVLTEAESGSIVLLDSSASGAGDNIRISLPLLGDDATATTITTGLTYEIIVNVTPGDAASLVEISTGDDAVNMNVFSSLLGTVHDNASGQVLGGPGVRGTLAHSKLILTPNLAGEALNTRIICRSTGSAIWDIRAEEPAAAISNFSTDAGAAFA